MRGVRSLAVVLGLLAATSLAAGAANAEEPAGHAEVRMLFEQLREAARPGPPQLHLLYDQEALLQRCASVLGRAVSDAERRALGAALREELAAQEEGKELYQFEDLVVLSWRPTSDGREAQTCVVLRAGSTAWTILAWLRRDSTQAPWRFVDSEYLVSPPGDALRIVRRAGLKQRTLRHFTSAMDHLFKARAALDDDKHADALRLLESVPGAPLPAVVQALVHLLRSRALLAQDRAEEALAAARAARTADPQLVFADLLAATAFEALDRLPEALGLLESYRAEVGDELRGLRARLRITETLGRAADALALADIGVATHPAFYEFASARLRLLPAGRKREGLPAFAGSVDLAAAARLAVEPQEAEDADPETLDALVTLLEGRAGNEALAAHYRAARALGRNDHAAALALLGAALGGEADEDAREGLCDLLVRLPWHGEDVPQETVAARVLEAFAAASPVDRAYVFSGLAYGLADDQDAEGLGALLRRAQDLGGVGPDYVYYEAEIAWLNDEHAAALRHLERLQIPDPLPPGSHSSLETVFGRWPSELRVRCLLRLRRADEALPSARDYFVRGHGTWPLLYVYAALGRVDAAIRAFDACVEEGRNPRWLYEDEDAQPHLGAEAYAALRARHGLGK